MRKTSIYVACVALTALLLGMATFALTAGVTPGSIQAVLLLAVLGLLAEMLGFVLPRSASGSVSFIPYLALVLISPTWMAVVAITVVKGTLELIARRTPTKGLFNASQYALAQAIAVLTYRFLGGVSLYSLPSRSLADVSLAVGVPAAVACAVSLLVSTSLVSVAIGLSTGNPIRAVWSENNRTTIGLDLVAGPLILVFAWVCVAFGPIAIAALWVPILGLRQVHSANLELETVNRELLELMVKSIEARDPYTSGHSRRVQHYAVTIARALLMPENEVRRISQAALLHDVGKIHEKYAPILRKPDRLTADEWRVMLQHPIDGANLIATVSGLAELIPAIRHHHENWDGTGYPDGLAGELIPIASRVIMFADTIDAMTTERPYRAPLTEEQVRAEIVRCRGRQFDPALADRLLSSPMWSRLFSPVVTPAPRAGYSVLRIVQGGREAKADRAAASAG